MDEIRCKACNEINDKNTIKCECCKSILKGESVSHVNESDNNSRFIAEIELKGPLYTAENIDIKKEAGESINNTEFCEESIDPNHMDNSITIEARKINEITLIAADSTYKSRSNATNTKQLQIIVDQMEKYPDIANGFAQRKNEEVCTFWRTLVKELNIAGPPLKSIFEWKKVWSDKKKYIRKKMSENLKLKDTTGKENRFSPLEETIINICGMSESVGGSSDAKRFGLHSCNKKRKLEDCDDLRRENLAGGSSQIKTTLQSNQQSLDVDEAHLTGFLVNSDDDCAQTDKRTDDLDDSANSINKTKQKGRQKTRTNDLLEKKLQLQRKLCDRIGEAILIFKNHQADMEMNVNKIYGSIDRLCDQQKLALEETRRHNNEMEGLKRHEVEENQRHNDEMEKLRKQEIEGKLEHKQRLLEIEEEKLTRLQ